MKKTKTKIAARKSVEKVLALPKKRVAKQKLYPMSYFWIALAAVLIIESIAFGLITVENLKVGFELFDLSHSVEGTKVVLQIATAPMVDTFIAVNDFYIAAADELIYLLQNDLTSDLATLIEASDNFYNQAATEMIALLDDSGYWFEAQGQVAGISIEK